MAGRAASSRTLTRRIGWGLVASGGLGFVVLAALLVPWDPVPGPALDPAAAGDVFSSGQLDRAEHYSRIARTIGWSSLGVSLLVSCLLGFTPVGARLLGRLRLPWPLTVLGLVAAVLAIGRLATLPFAWWSRELRLEEGLTDQGAGAWALDQVKSLGMSIVITAIAVLVLVGCARRWRTWWPVVAAALSVALVLAGSFLYPLVVEPVFNDFRSMPDGELRTQILRIAEHEDVDVDDVLIADASRRTTTYNAYVSGLWGTRRVVVYDNLVRGRPDHEVLTVVAHELAHAKHRDVAIGTTLGATGAVAGIGVLALVTGGRWQRRRTETDDLADPRVVALLLALMAVATLVTSPVQNTISRQLETRADVTSMRAYPNEEAFASMQRHLCLRSRCDPTPPAWSQFWFGSHPTVLQRIAIARRLGSG